MQKAKSEMVTRTKRNTIKRLGGGVKKAQRAREKLAKEQNLQNEHHLILATVEVSLTIQVHP